MVFRPSDDTASLIGMICVLRSKKEGDLPACYQRSLQKPMSLMVWGCISAYSMGSLHVLEGTMNAERYIKALVFKLF